jgi:hypothetical protein
MTFSIAKSSLGYGGCSPPKFRKKFLMAEFTSLAARGKPKNRANQQLILS